MFDSCQREYRFVWRVISFEVWKFISTNQGKRFTLISEWKAFKIVAALWVAYLLECKYLNLNSNFDNSWSYLNDMKQADIC